MVSDRCSQQVFFGVSVLLFAASAALTIAWCTSMPVMGEMLMPGGWIMSMAWMRMPGQSWSGAAAGFLGMWVVMMVAMMLPSLVPMLSGYRRSVRDTTGARRAGLTLLAGLGYFVVWAAYGAVAYPVGLSMAAAEMRSPGLSRSVPLAAGLAVLLAGCLQLT